MSEVTVVGAGVVGLTCAVALREAGFDVEVVARDEPTVSEVAGGLWFPYSTGEDERTLRWARETYEWLEGRGVPLVEYVHIERGEPTFFGALPPGRVREGGPYEGRGRSWVGLFDPVGAPSDYSELVWRFIERSRAQGGRASFYQVRPQTLPMYLDAGLRVLKLGEYASVSLPHFSLKGRSRSDLRQAINRGERENLAIEIIPASSVPPLLHELRAISDSWLAQHKAAEKGFSLGAFVDTYVERLPVALVRDAGRIVAFATLMTTDARIEASVDLMRHVPDAPNGTMDFLFVKLLQHFQAEGFQRFGLGMAPLSGMAQHPLAPNWHRLGRMLFSHGEQVNYLVVGNTLTASTLSFGQVFTLTVNVDGSWSFDLTGQPFLHLVGARRAFLEQRPPARER